MTTNLYRILVIFPYIAFYHVLFPVLVLFQVLFQNLYTNSCYVLHILQICKRNCWHYALSSAHQPHRTGDPSSQQGGCKAVPVVTSYRARRHGQQRLRQHYLGVTLNGVNRLIETLSSEYCVTLFPYIRSNVNKLGERVF